MATAVTVSQAYDNTLTPQGYLDIAYLTECGPGFTYTPTNSSGKTIKILSAYNETSGSSVVATVSAGVIILDTVDKNIVEQSASEASVADDDDVTIIYTKV